MIKSLKLFFLYSLLFMILGCNQTEIDNQKNTFFTFPTIFNSDLDRDSEISNDIVNSISGVFPRVIGKYRFCDTINVGVENPDTSLLKDYFFDKIFRYTIIDSLDVNGFELFTDYETTVSMRDRYISDSLYFDYYPVYLVNSTKSDKLFLAKDSYAFGIQEAKFIEDKRSYNFWYAIEGLGWDWCGNGNWGVIVHPQEFIMILMRKYKGDYETSLRVRLRVGETTYVSRGFRGQIHEEQFEIEENSFIDRMTDGEYGYAADDVFFGARPKWNK